MRIFDGQPLKSPLRRIGVIPGSFNPPHPGHVDLALKAMRIVSLDVCFFYINSICQRKQHELAPQSDRIRLLKMMARGHEDLYVIAPTFFSDNPGSGFCAQEELFPKLIDKICQSLDVVPQVWLVRGSDNFRPLEKSGYVYPENFRQIPHVIGIRAAEDWTYDYSSVTEKVFVQTSFLSLYGDSRPTQHSRYSETPSLRRS